MIDKDKPHWYDLFGRHRRSWFDFAQQYTLPQFRFDRLLVRQETQWPWTKALSLENVSTGASLVNQQNGAVAIKKAIYLLWWLCECCFRNRKINRKPPAERNKHQYGEVQVRNSSCGCFCRNYWSCKWFFGCKLCFWGAWNRLNIRRGHSIVARTAISDTEVDLGDVIGIREN